MQPANMSNSCLVYFIYFFTEKFKKKEISYYSWKEFMKLTIKATIASLHVNVLPEVKLSFMIIQSSADNRTPDNQIISISGHICVRILNR
jgi:hypothetical protein